MLVDFIGYWKMLVNENFEEYLCVFGKCCLLFCVWGELLVVGVWGFFKFLDLLLFVFVWVSVVLGFWVVGRVVGVVVLRVVGRL